MRDEAKKIQEIIEKHFPFKLDGRTCIDQMRSGGSSNWRQMEWMGFFVEEWLRNLLIQEIGGSEGPKYNNTIFDYQKSHVWDIKIHPTEDAQGKSKPWAILNDRESIESALNDYRFIGFILAMARAEFDQDGAFKKWHDCLKGKTSKYVRERIRRGAPSRLRKKGAIIKGWIIFGFWSKDEIERGLQSGWIKEFQEGMRNANGSPRRPKIMVNMHEIPKQQILITI